MVASLKASCADSDVLQYLFTDDGRFPNSRLPLLVYRHAAGEDAGNRAAFFERRFTENRWPAAWRNGIYGFHHYHSTAHEALGICSGHATLRMGGPAGETLAVKAGDVVVIPAGVAHKRLQASADFLVMGAYPKGQRWDMNDGSPGERPGADANIDAVSLPAADPIWGPDGPLMQSWRGDDPHGRQRQ